MLLVGPITVLHGCARWDAWPSLHLALKNCGTTKLWNNGVPMVLLEAFTPDPNPLGKQWLSALVALLPILSMLITLGAL